MIRSLTRSDPDYPAVFATIGEPPATLWVRGRVPPEPGVAIVGTRRATRYGIELAREMGRAVASHGWWVVSGLARGIDGAAHRGCVEVGGPGVAVLGSGVDVWYPPEHRLLGEQLIEAGGGVVSEYPPGTTPRPHHFPARNRIISALAAVVVVIEAAVQGGALITARLAAEQGREVFAVPGDVSRPTSVGTNLLIRDGALPILGGGDLVEALSVVMGPPPRSPDRSLAISDLEIPMGGAPIDRVVELNGGDTATVLVALGRLEAEGRIRIEEGRVDLT